MTISLKDERKEISISVSHITSLECMLEDMVVPLLKSYGYDQEYIHKLIKVRTVNELIDEVGD